MTKPALIVFDIAGTTVRDNGNVAAAFMEAFGDSGYAIARQEAQQVMGYRKSDAIRLLLRRHGRDVSDPALVEEIHKRFNEKMIRFYNTTPDLKPFEDVEDLFNWLREKKIRIALNTGFTSPITHTILNRLGWKEGETVDAVVSSDQVENGRPAPDMIIEMMQRFGIGDPKAVVKVGDTESDVEEGRQAGCGLVVGVTTGAYSRKQLEKYHPDHVIDRLGSLKIIINQLS
jgi:phosphonatase-like hydrolase